jgi:hypothetical protein
VAVKHHSLLGDSVEITATLTQDFGSELGENLLVRPGTESRQEGVFGNDNSLMRISYRRCEGCS